MTPAHIRQLGYKDGLLDKPYTYAGPEYRHGYANGQTDRRFFRLSEGWIGDSNLGIDRAVYGDHNAQMLQKQTP